MATHASYLSCLALLCSALAFPTQDQPASDVSMLKKQRVETLESLCDQLRLLIEGTRGQVSHASFESLMNAKLELFEARFESNSVPHEKLLLFVEVRKEFSSFVQMLEERNEASIYVLAAKARQLELEIRYQEFLKANE